MLDLIITLGFDVFKNLLQIVISSIISILAYYSINQKIKVIKTGYVYDIVIIVITAFLGILLPLNTFGVLPIFFVLLRLRLKTYLVLPIIFSNIIFNMLVPFNDPTFIWRTGIKRVIFAVVIGIVAGIIIKSLKKDEAIVKIKKASDIFDEAFSLRLILRNIHDNINLMGIYMICGTLINNLFDKYILYNLTSQVFSNQNTAFIPRLFARFNVVHPGFLMATTIIFALLNFTNLSAMIIILKPKGFVLYVSYFMIWTVLLGTTLFF